jgi:hypothetical protein
VAAALAGAIFIGVQINHPPADSFLTDTNEWVIRCSAKAVMGALALAGITGIYLRQVRQMRVLGLVGFVIFAAGYLLGGLIFGVALFRAGVLARWAAALLAVSTLGTAALAVLPEAFNRPMAVPEGVALIGLGVSLWRLEGRTPAADRPVPAARRGDSPATSTADLS